LKRVVRLETGNYYSFSGLTKQTTIQEIESGVGLLGYETYQEIKDPLFLLNYGIETYFSKNWYEPNGYRFTTYSSTGPKGVAEKTSWATPDPKDIPFRKWNVVASNNSYTNQSTTLHLKPFQSQVLPPGSVGYGYFVVSVKMFTPGGVMVPPQQIRVANKSLDTDGNAYITAQYNSGYIDVTPTTAFCGNYQYTLVVTELSPRIELFEPSSKSEMTYVDDLDNNADTTLVFVRRGPDKLVVSAKPNLPGAFYTANGLPGFVLSNGTFDPVSGLYKREVNLGVNAQTDVYCQFGGQYRKIKIVTYSANITGFGDCGFWPANENFFPKEANPVGIVPGQLSFGDQESTIDFSVVYPLNFNQVVNAGQRLDIWRKNSELGLEVYNLIFRNCTTCYIEFSNVHAASNIPTSIYNPLGLYKYWSTP